MNFMPNSTFTNPFMGGGMMYGNYIDIFFRHIMENGFEGIKLITIINFYLYLSLDKIKDLFKVMNDWMSEKITEYIKYYQNIGIQKLKEYQKIILEFIKKYFSQFFQKFKKGGAAPVQPTQKDCNKVKVTIKSDNKTDQIALGNYLLKKKSDLDLTEYIRERSDKDISVEIYALPPRITLKENDIGIIINQNVDYSLVCETDGKTEILKDTKVKVEDDFEKIVDWSSFQSIAGRFPNINLNTPSFSSYGGWSSCPDNFFNGGCRYILKYIYWTKDSNMLKSIYNFVSGRGTFDFCGKKYKLSDSNSDHNRRLTDDSKMEEFIAEWLDYCENKFIAKNKDQKESIDEWVSKNSYAFEPVIKIVPAIDITFESETKSAEDLLSFSRIFMKDLISDYYQQNIESTDNKVSIYQLKVNQEVKIKKKDNPRYTEWMEIYGEKKEETKEGETKEDVKEEPKERFRYDYMRIPPMPSKFIEEEISTPVAEAINIKTDRKPFQYLYLQKKQKSLLESYLKNFKNNRDKYEMYGLGYHAGIVLSGSPGCGKSSTILAIATFLNKDVYYLDLGKIKTNEELKLCVDYVSTNSKNGGVIIFEDIDCMTNIVMKRDAGVVETSITKTSDTSNEPLSLSYLLNILDGTMAPNNTVFIMTTNHLEKLDPALIRPGRMDLNITIDKCTRYQLEQIYTDMYGKNLDKEIAKRFTENKFMTAEVILHLFHNIFNKNLSVEELLQNFLE